jgi:hypothetical protein
MVEDAANGVGAGPQVVLIPGIASGGTQRIGIASERYAHLREMTARHIPGPRGAFKVRVAVPISGTAVLGFGMVSRSAPGVGARLAAAPARLTLPPGPA